MLEKKISFSEYSTYINCPHKWYLLYHLKLQQEFSEELLFGSAIHSTIESILTNKHLFRLYTMNREAAARDIFKGFLKDELAKITDVNFLTMFNKRNLATSFIFQAGKLINALAIERKFLLEYEVMDVEFKLENIVLFESPELIIRYKGFIDLILRSRKTGKYLILDWKSSRKAWDINKKLKDNEDFFAQLCLYKNFYSKVKEIDMRLIETKFYNLPREEETKQSPYEGILNERYINAFIKKFTDTSIKIAEHSQSLTNFSKAKNITKKNFCFRCNFNKADTCDDTTEFQVVTPL